LTNDPTGISDLSNNRYAAVMRELAHGLSGWSGWLLVPFLIYQIVAHDSATLLSFKALLVIIFGSIAFTLVAIVAGRLFAPILTPLVVPFAMNNKIEMAQNIQNTMLAIFGLSLCIVAWFFSGHAVNYAYSSPSQQVPESTVKVLEENFLMTMVLQIIKRGQNRESIRAYIGGQSNRYHHFASQHQGEMIVEGYSVLDLKAPIIGYSLFFHQSSGTLVLIDASVNPLNAAAMVSVAQLVDKSFDSVASEDNSKLHWLGLRDLDNQRVLKIMIREAKGSLGKEYAVRYAISEK